MNLPSLSVIIPSCNDVSRLQLTLLAISKQDVVDDIEVILVNDRKEPLPLEVQEKLRTTIPSLQILNSNQSGAASARNIGAQFSSSEILLFCDDDIIFNNTFIANHLFLQKQNNALVHMGGYDILEVLRKKSLASSATINPHLDYLFLFKNNIQDNLYRLHRNKLELIADYIINQSNHVEFNWLGGIGGNLSLKKHQWEDVSGFDENFSTRWGCEDLDFAFRLNYECNLPIYYCNNVKALHLPTYREGSWIMHSKNYDYFENKHTARSIEIAAMIFQGNTTKADFIEKLQSLVE